MNSVHQVSAIVPVFNAEDTCFDTIQSILGQSYDNIEVIIVDDGSCDRTAQLVEGFKDHRIKFVRHTENQGVAAARNTAIRIASSRFIAFCDGDDQWFPEKLSKQIEKITENDAVLCHTWVERGKKPRVLNNEIQTSPLSVTYNDMLVRNWLVNSSVMIDLSKIGDVMQEPVKHEDYLFWLKILQKDSSNSVCVDEVLTFYYENPNGLSSNKLKSLFWHFGIQRKMGLSLIEIARYFFQNIKTRIR